MKQYLLYKEKWSEFQSNKARYYSTTDNAYFDYGGSPLTIAKKHAKSKGYDQLVLGSNHWNKPDKIYNL